MKIYVDMDQVLCDFMGGVVKAVGEPFDSTGIPKVEKKAMINAKKDFWQTLEWLEGSKNLWKYLTSNPDHEINILSAYAAWDTNSKPGKRVWIKKNLKPKPNKIFLVKREQKQNFADKNSILIDDYIKNVHEWESAGGKAVHHINRNTTIAKLKKLGI